jgi:hypothetical protein
MKKKSQKIKNAILIGLLIATSHYAQAQWTNTNPTTTTAQVGASPSSGSLSVEKS